MGRLTRTHFSFCSTVGFLDDPSLFLEMLSVDLPVLSFVIFSTCWVGSDSEVVSVVAVVHLHEHRGQHFLTGSLDDFCLVLIGFSLGAV